MNDPALLQRRPPPPIPVTVLTGFLGAGKTTLLNRWVKSAAFADAAVVINEFGEIGLDHLLVEKAEGTVLTLSSGCLCCTIRGDMIATLEDLIRRRDNGRVPPFARLLIETTGLADPAPILNTILFHPYLPMRYRMDGVVTVVDALNGAANIAEHEEALRQAAVADLIVLSKTDLPEVDTKLPALHASLRRLNPGARVVEAAQATAEMVLSTGMTALDERTDSVRAWLDPAQYESPHHHGHAHDINRHDSRIAATCLVSEAPLEDSAFAAFLDLLRSTYGAHLLRAKGLVALRSKPDRPLLIHGVQHYFHPTRPLNGWPDPDRRTRLVLITRDLDPAVLERLWGAFFEGPALDRPDAAGLAGLSAPDQSRGLFG